MDNVRDRVPFLNPGQAPVIAADQPLYALAKQIQWHWPENYGEDKFVLMFGGLHIEMAAFQSNGSLLKGSGWTSALTEARVASSSTAESFLLASSVTRTRQAHQITAVKEMENSSEVVSFEDLMLCLHSEVKAKCQHGKHGMCAMMMYLRSSRNLASIHL